MKYNKEELELLEEIEHGNLEAVAFDNEEIKTMANDTLEYLKQKKTNQYQYQTIRPRFYQTKS